MATTRVKQEQGELLENVEGDKRCQKKYGAGTEREMVTTNRGG
jgi:hypothetical protein